MSVEAARARIEELKGDKNFYQRLVVQKEVAANRKWDALHKAGYPSAPVVDASAYGQATAARTEQAGRSASPISVAVSAR